MHGHSSVYNRVSCTLVGCGCQQYVNTHCIVCCNSQHLGTRSTHNQVNLTGKWWFECMNTIWQFASHIAPWHQANAHKSCLHLHKSFASLNVPESIFHLYAGAHTFHVFESGLHHVAEINVTLQRVGTTFAHMDLFMCTAFCCSTHTTMQLCRVIWHSDYTSRPWHWANAHGQIHTVTQFMLNQWVELVPRVACAKMFWIAPAASTLWQCHTFNSCLTSEVEFVPRFACANMRWIAPHDAMHIYILVASHIQQSCNSHDCTRWCVHAHHHMCCVDIWIMPHTQFMLNQWVELVPRVACAKMLWMHQPHPHCDNVTHSIHA